MKFDKLFGVRACTENPRYRKLPETQFVFYKIWGPK
jgi:hypothetical protein